MLSEIGTVGFFFPLYTPFSLILFALLCWLELSVLCPMPVVTVHILTLLPLIKYDMSCRFSFFSKLRKFLYISVLIMNDHWVIIPQFSRSLANLLSSLHLSGSFYICFTYNIQGFSYIKQEEWQGGIHLLSISKSKSKFIFKKYFV